MRPSPASVAARASRRRARGVARAAHARDERFTRAEAREDAREATSIARDMARRVLAPKSLFVEMKNSNRMITDGRAAHGVASSVASSTHAHELWRANTTRARGRAEDERARWTSARGCV